MRPIIKYFLGTMAAVAITALMVSAIDVSVTARLIRGTDAVFLLYASCLYVAAHTFRALRFSVLLGGHTCGVGRLFAVVSMHNFLNQILPLRSGEGAFPIIAGRVTGIDLAVGTSALLVARVYDLSVFIILLSVSLSAVAYSAANEGRLVVIVLTVASLVAVSACLLLLKRIDSVAAGGAEMVAGILGKMGRPGERVGKFIWRVGTKVKGLGIAGRMPSLLGYSGGVWACTFGMFYVFMLSVGFDPGVFSSVLGSAGAVLATMLPVNSPGSVGTLEGGWVAGQGLVGADPARALASGVLMHAFVVGFGAILSCLGLIYLKVANARS